MSENLPLFVSVIIPVYNDAEPLRLCLKALKQQTYSQDFYEVVVVDNGSDDQNHITEIIQKFDFAIAEKENKLGSYAARNKGIRVAKGKIIAFTDADCIPAPDWLEKGVGYLRKNPNCGLVGGNIEVIVSDRNNSSTVELYQTILAFRQQDCIEKHHYSVTANLFTWKSVINRVGDFNSLLKSNGDIEWGNRVYAQGYQQIYAEDVKIAHPTVHSFQQLRKKVVRYAGGAYDRRHQPEYSLFKQNWLFFQAVAFNLMPPVFFAVNNYNDPRIPTIKDKLKVISTMILVRYITVLELIRLKLGGVSARQ